MKKTLFFALLLALSCVACGSQTRYIANTSVEDTAANRGIIKTVELYRVALERRDASKLILLASKKYWEDSGTSDGGDDYGYLKLQEILTKKLERAKDIRYSLKYQKVRLRGERAWVDVLVDASFTLEDVDGNERRHDLRDRNQFVLEREGKEWRFLSGM